MGVQNPDKKVKRLRSSHILGNQTIHLKGALTGLRQFLAIEISLKKVMKNAFFHLKSSLHFQYI